MGQNNIKNNCGRLFDCLFRLREADDYAKNNSLFRGL